VIPQVLIVTGVVALTGGWLALRRLGANARLGRILAATPVIGIAHARALADSGRTRYVAVAGRIEADGEFEDEHQRPLVYRRTRLEAGGTPTWTALEDTREAVPFELSEGVDTIGIETEDLDEGLVVVIREAEGTAGEIPGRVPADLAPDTPVRLRVEQLSSVDHALALGVPMRDAERGVVLRSGIGRPLILTNLERAEALRLLAAGRRGSTLLASALLALGIGLIAVAIAWGLVGALGIALAPPVALAASPVPTAAAVGDPRSSGQGPGLVGDPLAAVVAVAAIAGLALVATLLYVRATGGPRRERREP
jgi:hypothetical protein